MSGWRIPRLQKVNDFKCKVTTEAPRGFGAGTGTENSQREITKSVEENPHHS
jgi:hypothetical protein